MERLRSINLQGIFSKADEIQDELSFVMADIVTVKASLLGREDPLSGVVCLALRGIENTLSEIKEKARYITWESEVDCDCLKGEEEKDISLSDGYLTITWDDGEPEEGQDPEETADSFEGSDGLINKNGEYIPKE